MSRIAQRKTAATSLVIALAVVVPGLALGQAAPEGTERTAAARALFEEGMQAVDARDWSTAADRLGRSHALRASPVVRYNLALALSELGRFVEASEHLRAVERESAPGSDARRLAGERLQAILPRLGSLRVEITGPRTQLEVRLDGAALPEALIGVPQPADPGTHRVSLHRAGDELAAREVSVSSGALAEISLAAPPLVAAWQEDAPLGSASPAPPPGIESEWWFWTSIGALAVGAAVAIALGLTLGAAPEQLPYLTGDSGTVHPTLLEFP